DEGEARAAVLLGEDQAVPAELGHLLPELTRVAGLVVHHLPDERHRALLREEVARRLSQHLLVFAEPKVHIFPFRPRAVLARAAPLLSLRSSDGPRSPRQSRGSSRHGSAPWEVACYCLR